MPRLDWLHDLAWDFQDLVDFFLIGLLGVAMFVSMILRAGPLG